MWSLWPNVGRRTRALQSSHYHPGCHFDRQRAARRLVRTLGIRTAATEIHSGIRLEQQELLWGQECTIDSEVVELELGREFEEDALYAGKSPLSEVIVE